MYLTENRLSWNECTVLQIITIICVTHVQKNFKIQASIKQLWTKYQISTMLPQISHFHKNRNFSKYICNFLDQLLHPYKLYGRDMSGILFFIFASCEPLRSVKWAYLPEIPTPLREMFLKSSTEGVWSSNGVSHCPFTKWNYGEKLNNVASDAGNPFSYF